MEQIGVFFEDALVHGYEHLVGTMTCDPKDRHVLAAAIVGGANQIVTNNTRDFPLNSTQPYGIEVVDADTFLQNVFDLYPGPALEELLDQAASLRKPTQSIHEVLAALSRHAPNFSQNAFTALTARSGGFGRTGAAQAAEIAFAALMNARNDGRDATLRENILYVDDRLVAGFARNGGLGRLQALVDRIRVQANDRKQLIAVFGSRLMEREELQLAQLGIAVAWVSSWNPTLQFDGSRLAREVAPWLFNTDT